jgi:hypothetical protein
MCLTGWSYGGRLPATTCSLRERAAIAQGVDSDSGWPGALAEYLGSGHVLYRDGVVTNFVGDGWFLVDAGRVSAASSGRLCTLIRTLKPAGSPRN